MAVRSGSLGAIGAVDVSDNAHSDTLFFSLSAFTDSMRSRTTAERSAAQGRWF